MQLTANASLRKMFQFAAAGDRVLRLSGLVVLIVVAVSVVVPVPAAV